MKRVSIQENGLEAKAQARFPSISLFKRYQDLARIKESSRNWFSQTHDSFLRHSARGYIRRKDLGDRLQLLIRDERGDVPGWVLVVLMTTGLVTAIWAIAAPRISSLLRNSLDSMNNVR